MAKLLYIESSPRKKRSASIAIAQVFLDEYRRIHPSDEVITVDLWQKEMPDFDGDTIEAKYAILHGKELSPEQAVAWNRVEAIINEFKAADKYVISLPMWNFGIPYRLKHYIDILVQPGYTFSFSPQTGFKGLVTGKPMTLIYARGGAYGAETGSQALDLQTRYMQTILNFIGFDTMQSIVIEPTLGPSKEEKEKLLRLPKSLLVLLRGRFNMAGTILSIIVAIFFVLNALEVAWQPQYQSPIYVAASLLFLFIALIGRVMISKSVLRIQTKVMGAAQELYVKDRRLHLSLLYLFALCLFSIFITLTTLPSAFFYIWIIAFGVGFDILRFSLRRSYQYTSTSFLVTRLVADLEQAVKDKDEAKAFEWLDVVIDSAAKAVSKSNMHLAVSSIKAIQSLIETYVKELARTEMFQVSALEGLTFLDKVNTMCIFVAERLAWLFGMALKEGQQPVAESIVSEFGKMSVFFARHNVRVATIPISFLASVAQTAQSMAQEEVQTRIALTLSETTKQLLAYSKDRNESFKDLIMSTLLTLEQIVKSIFKQKRETNVLLLMQPFAEIAEFIGSSQMAQVPDRDNVLREIKRVLSEFQALQMVTMNLETMSPSIGEDTTSSYQQDLPYTK